MTTHYDRDTITDYLHGALDARADAVLFEHLEACLDCRGLYDEEAGFGEALRAAAQREERELPPIVKARIREAIRAERPSWLARAFTSPLRMALPAAAAAAVVAAVVAGPALHGAAPSPVSAAYYLDAHEALQQTALGPGTSPGMFGSAASPAPAAFVDAADATTLDDVDGAAR